MVIVNLQHIFTRQSSLEFGNFKKGDSQRLYKILMAHWGFLGEEVKSRMVANMVP